MTVRSNMDVNRGSFIRSHLPLAKLGLTDLEGIWVTLEKAQAARSSPHAIKLDSVLGEIG